MPFYEDQVMRSLCNENLSMRAFFFFTLKADEGLFIVHFHFMVCVHEG